MIQAHITAGVARKLAPSLLASRYRPIPVGKHAQSHVQHARIPALFNVILALARPAASRVRNNRAFAARARQESFAGKPTTKMAGAARMFAAICCPVVSIRVKCYAIVDSAANARCK